MFIPITKAGHNDYFAKTTDIVDFDVNDEKARKNAFYSLKKEDQERYVLVEYKGKIIRKNVEEITKQNEKDVYNKSLRCSYCYAPVTIYGGKVQKLHPRHRMGMGDPDCPFMTVSKKKNSQKYSTIAETKEHREAKKRLLEELPGQCFPYPTGYEILLDPETGKTKWENKYVYKKIVKVESEVRVLKKNEETKGYQPDLLLTFEDSSIMALEITVSNGKTVHEYGDIWRRWGHPVAEIRLYGQYACNLDDEDSPVFQVYATFYNEADEKRTELELELQERRKRMESIEQVKDTKIKQQLIQDACYEDYLLGKSIGFMEDKIE